MIYFEDIYLVFTARWWKSTRWLNFTQLSHQKGKHSNAISHDGNMLYA
jgi:hypothetical protein